MDLKVESNIKHLIHHKGYDNKRLAEELGVSLRSIQRWVSGDAFPDIEALVKMSAIFDCSLDDLISYKSLANTDFDREDCFSYKDLTDLGFNGSLAHGVIKQINSTKKVEDIPVMLVDNKVKLVYKTEVVDLLNGLLEKVS
ncbi:helix-turn-helix transcriptional regulator [uncultured Streptococcus sp.]|uniref:helix-turn-helix transcriptional regulator n=1 Tax=uncultured Streptococcus sp. TaxID=83427 RepID=UPI0025EB9D44|nr:helix-turn-helix transcriptional regulator [uncultured Streptococcus sp.]